MPSSPSIAESMRISRILGRLAVFQPLDIGGDLLAHEPFRSVRHLARFGVEPLRRKQYLRGSY
jgi:hypothetical protein